MNQTDSEILCGGHCFSKTTAFSWAMQRTNAQSRAIGKVFNECVVWFCAGTVPSKVFKVFPTTIRSPPLRLVENYRFWNIWTSLVKTVGLSNTFGHCFDRTIIITNTGWTNDNCCNYDLRKKTIPAKCRWIHNLRIRPPPVRPNGSWCDSAQNRSTGI